MMVSKGQGEGEREKVRAVEFQFSVKPASSFPLLSYVILSGEYLARVFTCISIFQLTAQTRFRRLPCRPRPAVRKTEGIRG